jgi:protein-S-isoprenylcysteine O-methyltransferase Ste14
MTTADTAAEIRIGADAVPRPRSASALWTGFAGLAVAGLAAMLVRDWLQPDWLKTLAVMGAAAGAMMLADALLYRTWLNPTTGLTQAALRPLDVPRVALKLAGLWLSIAALAVAYALAAEYSGDLYTSFKSAALWCLPGLAVAAPFYIAYVDRRQRDPDDAYQQLGSLLVGRLPVDWSLVREHALGWAVKGFFLPLMFAFTHNGLVALWARDSTPSPADFAGFFTFLIDTLYLCDVLLAAVAYTLTLRLLDTHIRSVEPTIFGWLICLVCYQPFVNGSLNAYFNYNKDDLYWGAVFARWPALYVAWGTAILVLVGIYVLATVAFGLRFSNLTNRNRGIITSGPYRWVKHPAYLAKNLSWWLISVPFVAGAGWVVAVQSCALLVCVNLIYFLRAKTEERHLRADPAYRDYEAFIAEHGLVAVLRRAIGMRGRKEAPG